MSEVWGYRSVRESLAQMEACEQAVGRALVAGAQEVRNEARNLAPRKTGNLRRSIDIGNLQSSGGTVTVEVGTDVEYARRIEYGFNGADSLGRVYHQAARPYLEPACEAKSGDVEKKVEEAIGQLWR